MPLRHIGGGGKTTAVRNITLPVICVHVCVVVGWGELTQSLWEYREAIGIRETRGSFAVEL